MPAKKAQTTRKRSIKRKTAKSRSVKGRGLSYGAALGAAGASAVVAGLGVRLAALKAQQNAKKKSNKLQQDLQNISEKRNAAVKKQNALRNAHNKIWLELQATSRQHQINAKAASQNKQVLRNQLLAANRQQQHLQAQLLAADQRHQNIQAELQSAIRNRNRFRADFVQPDSPNSQASNHSAMSDLALQAQEGVAEQAVVANRLLPVVEEVARLQPAAVNDLQNAMVQANNAPWDPARVMAVMERAEALGERVAERVGFEFRSPFLGIRAGEKMMRDLVKLYALMFILLAIAIGVVYRDAQLRQVLGNVGAALRDTIQTIGALPAAGAYLRMWIRRFLPDMPTRAS